MSSVPHNRIRVLPGDPEVVASVIATGQWASGPRVEELEAALADLVGRRFAVCVASGLSAIRLSLLALGVRPGQSVAVPAFSCVALANATLAVGATPIEIDIQSGSWNLRAELLPDDCSAAIIVNTFGMPASFPQGQQVPTVEDCAHALGFGVPLMGSRGTVSVASFYATKLLGGGEGGAVLTDDPTIAEAIMRMRDYSDKAPSGQMLNDKMSDVHAALILHRLGHLSGFVGERRHIASGYQEAFAALESAGALKRPRSGNETWYRYVVEVPGRLADDVISGLSVLGVQAASPIDDWRSDPSSSPCASHAYSNLVSLPIYPGLTEEEIARTIDAVTQVARGAR